MPKYRKLYTKTIDSFDFNDLPDDFTRLTWLMLPLVSCREGRGIINARWLKSKLFPMREDVSAEMVQSAIFALYDIGMIKVYTVKGREYYEIVNWHKYQGTTTREAESDYPAPPEIVSQEEVEQAPPPVNEEVVTKSRTTHELVTTKSSTDSVFSIQYSDADAVTSISENRQPTPKTETAKTANAANADYAIQEILNAWSDLFHDKPQPRDTKALRGKIARRLKDKHFVKHWSDAMTRASRSSFLAGWAGFTFHWFLGTSKGQAHYERCLDGNYDDDKSRAPTNNGAHRHDKPIVVVDGVF